jgi:hypothetical protein
LDLSDIQSGNPLSDHDPFDSRNAMPNFYDSPMNHHPYNYHLYPLIYSAGPDKKYGLNVKRDYFYSINNTTPLSLSDFELGPYYFDDLAPYDPKSLVGYPIPEDDGTENTHLDNITNHRIETP